jgi:hypothetical protein
MDTKKNFLFFLTPCIIAAVGLFVMMVDSIVFLKRSKGDSYTGIIVALPFFIVYLITDYLLRRYLKKNLVVIWVIEIIILILSAILFSNYFPFKQFTVGH